VITFEHALNVDGRAPIGRYCWTGVQRVDDVRDGPVGGNSLDQASGSRPLLDMTTSFTRLDV